MIANLAIVGFNVRYLYEIRPSQYDQIFVDRRTLRIYAPVSAGMGPRPDSQVAKDDTGAGLLLPFHHIGGGNGGNLESDLCRGSIRLSE